MGNLQFSAGRIAIYVCLLVFAVLYLMPLYVMITTSLKDIERDSAGEPPRIAPYAADPVAQGLGKCMHRKRMRGLAPFFFNSIRIVVPAVLISTLIGALNGYVIAKWRFRGSEFYLVRFCSDVLSHFRLFYCQWRDC